MGEQIRYRTQSPDMRASLIFRLSIAVAAYTPKATKHKNENTTGKLGGIPNHSFMIYSTALTSLFHCTEELGQHSDTVGTVRR